MTGIGLPDPDEALREARERDLEAEREAELTRLRGENDQGPGAVANDDDGEAK